MAPQASGVPSTSSPSCPLTMISRGSPFTSTPRFLRIHIRWCPSSIVPSGRVFRHPSFWPGTSDAKRTSVERLSNFDNFPTFRELSGWSGFRGGNCRESTIALLHHPPRRVIPEHGCRKEQSVKAIQHASMTRQNRSRIFHPPPALDQRLHQIS